MVWEKILEMLDKVEEELKKSERSRRILPKIHESTIIKWIYYTAGRLKSFYEEYERKYEEYRHKYYSAPRYMQHKIKPPYGYQSKWEVLGDKTREAFNKFIDNFLKVGAEKVAVVIDRDEIFSRAEYGDTAILKISEFEDIVYDALSKTVLHIIDYGDSFPPYYEADIGYLNLIDDEDE
jgi:hypothetical protein